jgi:hypothetical protein
MTSKRDKIAKTIQHNANATHPTQMSEDEVPAAKPRHRPTTALSNLTPEQLLEQIPSNKTLRQLFGLKTDFGALGLMITTLNGLGVAGATYRDFVFALAAELEPEDAIEAMLITQMGVTHTTMMAASQRAWDATNAEAREAYDRIMNRLGRTFLAQVDQFRRYRSGGSQVVRVEHVNVNAGGQAIVGNVATNGGSREKGR